MLEPGSQLTTNTELIARALKKKFARRVLIFKSLDQLRLMAAHVPQVFASKPWPILTVEVGVRMAVRTSTATSATKSSTRTRPPRSTP